MPWKTSTRAFRSPQSSLRRTPAIGFFAASGQTHELTLAVVDPAVEGALERQGEALVVPADHVAAVRARVEQDVDLDCRVPG